MLCNWPVIRFCTPWPTDSSVITAPTPMMMPSIVSAERSLFTESARSARRSCSVRSIALSQSHAALRHADAVAVGRVTGDARLCDVFVPDNHAIIDVQDAAGVLGDVGLMRHQDHRDALVDVQLLEEAHHLGAGLGVQVAGRLVGQDDARIVHQRAGDGHALLLAA